MNFEALKTTLAGMTWKESALLADAADVPRSTVAKIRYSETANPRINTVEALIGALKKTARH